MKAPNLSQMDHPAILQIVFHPRPDPSPPDPRHDLAISAARGHTCIVGPRTAVLRQGRIVPATRQLLTFWAFESRWSRAAPHSHRAFRHIYNAPPQSAKPRRQTPDRPRKRLRPTLPLRRGGKPSPPTACSLKVYCATPRESFRHPAESVRRVLDRWTHCDGRGRPCIFRLDDEGSGGCP